MDIQLPQILFQLINFSVVVGAVSYLLYKPVLKILEERSKRVEEAQKAARETLLEKERLSEVEEEIVKKANKKAAKIVEDARVAAGEVETATLNKAKVTAEKEIERAKSNWEGEKKQHLVAMKSTFVDAVIATSQKVIAAELDSKKHATLLEKELNQLLKSL